MKSKSLTLVSLLLVGVMILLTACGPEPRPEVISKVVVEKPVVGTVVVEKEVVVEKPVVGTVVVKEVPTVVKGVQGTIEVGKFVEVEVEVPLKLTTGTVNVCTAAQIDQWNTVMNDQEGVDGRDPVGHRIGSYPAERGLYGIPGELWLGRNWYPADTEKQILCGKLHHFDYYDPSSLDEADWNNFIIPNPPYTHLITDLESLREEPWYTTGWHSCDGRFDCMEAEITPDEHFYGNPWFPRKYGDDKDESPLEDQTICTYGPWVWEEAHGNRPEIHPSELYWWGWGNGAIRLMLLHDDSNRFYDPDDFSDLPDPPPVWWRPWSVAPRTGEFRIPFEINLDPLEAIPIYIITEPGSWTRNVITSDFAAARMDSDSGTQHAIEYNGDIVLRADEAQLNDDNIGVQFVDICRDSANTRLQGYVQLTSVVGMDDSGGEGYHVIDVLRYELDAPEDDPPFTQPTAPEVTVLSGKTNRRTLRMQEADPKPELLADLEVSLLSGTGERPPDVVIVKVERVEGNERQELKFQANTENEGREGLLGVVKAVPSLSGSKLELTTDTGTVLHLNVPEVALGPLIFEETLLLVDSDASAWDTMLRIIGVSAAVVAPQPARIVNVHQWQLVAVPFYAPVRDGLISAEDDSPTAEELVEVWHRGDQPRIEELFGSSQPFTVDWSFEATNLVTGEAVPVVTDGGASATDIEVALLKDEIPNASIRITFPEALEGTIYEVVATATFRDNLGNEGKAEHRVWSHVLAAEDSDVLVEALLTTAAVVAGISPDDLTAASNLEGVDPSLRRARTLRLMTMRAAADKRITVAELRSLIQGAKLFQNE